MNPLRLRARSFRTFEDLDLELPGGCVAVLGENGSGKSSLVSIVDIALFGPESRTLADCLTDTGESTELMLELTFSHGGELYRVRRSYSARGRGLSKLDLERFELGWEPLTLESAAATQTAIEALLGFTRETFRASCFLAQGDGANFPEAQPRERKRLLAEILNLSRWERMLEAVRRDRRALEDELHRIAGELELQERELAQREVCEREHSASLTEVEVAASRVSSHERELAIGVEREQELERADAQHRARATAAQAARSALTVAQRLQQDAAAAANLSEEVEQELATLGEPEQTATLEAALDSARKRQHARARALEAEERRAEEISRRVLERNKRLADMTELNETARVLREKADHVEEDTATCDRCGQTLAAEAAERAIASYHAEADALDAKARELDEQASKLAQETQALQDEAVEIPDAPDDEAVCALETTLAQARDTGARVATLRERLAGYARTIAEAAAPEYVAELDRLERQLAEAEAALAEVDVDPEALAQAHERAAQARTSLELARERLDEARRAKERTATMLERLTLVAEAAEVNRSVRDERQTAIDLLAEAERAYGRVGIPMLVMENAAIPSIEAEASRILAELGGAATRVELRTQAALKSGDGVRDTLDIVCLTEAGERGYETFSGGERARVNVALRIGLARLLAHRRGAESRLLVLDEIEYLDEPGHAALARVLRELSGDFDRVYLVSHVPGLRDAFATTLSVVKEDGRSRIAA